MQSVAPQLATVMENYKVSLIVKLFINYELVHTCTHVYMRTCIAIEFLTAAVFVLFCLISGGYRGVVMVSAETPCDNKAHIYQKSVCGAGTST